MAQNEFLKWNKHDSSANEVIGRSIDLYSRLFALETIERETDSKPEEEYKSAQPLRGNVENKSLRANRLAEPPMDENEPELAGRES